MLDYDVRAHLHYFGSHSYSDIGYETTFGKTEASIMEDNSISVNVSEIPKYYSISNYPNPFNPTTTISYQLPEKSFVTIKVFDILGKEIATLVNETKPAGYYTVNFDGSKLTSGVYIYTISANEIVLSKKMILTK